MKVRAKNIDKQLLIETLDALYTSASTLRGRDAMKRFLRDLLTESERVMLGRRILIARMLLAGQNYDSIQENLSVGRDTIGRVQRWLSDQMPGYEDAVSGLESELAKRKKKSDEKYLFATSALYRLKKKYPLHFLLFPTPKRK